VKTFRFALTILLTAITGLSNAQLKIHSGGRISLGSTSTPINNFKLQVVGNSVFTASTGSTISSAFIRGLNDTSTSTTPEYTWWGDDQTGMYHPNGSVIGFTVYGNERMRIGSSEIMVSSSGDWHRSFYIKALSKYACGYHMRYSTSDNFYVTAEGKVFAEGVYSSSDTEFKKNIQTIAGALEKVKNLRGVTYQYNYSDSMAVKLPRNE